MSDRKLKVGIAGLGRMGARHAFNFNARTPRADLVAAFTPISKEAEWAATNLPGTTVYNDFDEFLRHPGLEAVVVATVTVAHAEEAIKAIEAGKHVLCEKPLSTSAEVVGFDDTPWFQRAILPNMACAFLKMPTDDQNSPNPLSTQPTNAQISKSCVGSRGASMLHTAMPGSGWTAA